MHKLLDDASILDGLPRIVAEEPKTQALAFAIRNQIKRLLAYADGLIILARLDTVEEWKLDAIALHLRVTEYRNTYPIHIKREMVKNALLFRNLAGTVYVTEELSKLILGDDTMLYEWFDYGDDPGYFMLRIYDMGISDEQINEFVKVMDEYKRLSAWLRKIQLIIEPPKHEMLFGTALLRSRRTMMISMNGMEFKPGFALKTARRSKYFCDYSHVKPKGGTQT